MSKIIKSIQEEIERCSKEIKLTTTDYYQFGRNVEFCYKRDYLIKWHEIILGREELMGVEMLMSEFDPTVDFSGGSSKYIVVTTHHLNSFCDNYLTANINQIKHRLTHHFISFSSNPFKNAKEVIERNADMDLLNLLIELQGKIEDNE